MEKYKMVNKMKYCSRQEFLDSLRDITREADYQAEVREGERYRAPGSDLLLFTSKREASDFWGALPWEREAE